MKTKTKMLFDCLNSAHNALIGTQDYDVLVSWIELKKDDIAFIKENIGHFENFEYYDDAVDFFITSINCHMDGGYKEFIAPEYIDTINSLKSVISREMAEKTKI